MSPRQPTWQDVVVDDLLVFSSPVALTRTTAAGVDTAFSEWQGDGLVVRIDYGLFVNPLAPGATEETIDGLPARIATHDTPDGRQTTAVHFPDLSSLARGRNKVTLVVEGPSSRSADDLRLLARSVRFRRTPPR